MSSAEPSRTPGAHDAPESAPASGNGLSWPDFHCLALDLARSGLLGSARAVLESQPTETASAALLSGLCAFSMGDVAAASQHWRRAVALQADSPARRWLDSLQRGAIAGALARYNDALALARAGDWQSARERLESLPPKLPDFAPLGRLLGLVRAAAGDLAGAQATWSEYAGRIRDDRPLRQYLESTAADPPLTSRALRRRRRHGALVASALIVVALGTVAGVATLRRHSRVATASLAGGAPGPASLSASAPLTIPSAAPPPMPQTLQAQVAAVRHSNAWRLFVRAQALAGEDRWRAAAPLLVVVSADAPGRFYHDDALYLLARAYARTGEPEAARGAAQELIRRYPASLFRNSILRSIAETGREP